MASVADNRRRPCDTEEADTQQQDHGPAFDEKRSDCDRPWQRFVSFAPAAKDASTIEMDDGVDHDGERESGGEEDDDESHAAALSAPVSTVQSHLLLEVPSSIIRAHARPDT
jgi:hypothetical protein